MQGAKQAGLANEGPAPRARNASTEQFHLRYTTPPAEQTAEVEVRSSRARPAASLFERA